MSLPIAPVLLMAACLRSVSRALDYVAAQVLMESFGRLKKIQRSSKEVMRCHSI